MREKEQLGKEGLCGYTKKSNTKGDGRPWGILGKEVKDHSGSLG